MYKIYRILSGEELNGQSKIDDFENVEFVCEVETFEEVLSLVGESEDLFYDPFIN